jgi:hypothetical protein
MPTDILALLIEERDRLNRAIEALGGAKRRSRPRKNPLVPTTAPEADRRKRTHTVARRKLQAQRMRAYWARTGTVGRRKQAKRMRAYWVAKRKAEAGR